MLARGTSTKKSEVGKEDVAERPDLRVAAERLRAATAGPGAGESRGDSGNEEAAVSAGDDVLIVICFKGASVVEGDASASSLGEGRAGPFPFSIALFS